MNKLPDYTATDEKLIALRKLREIQTDKERKKEIQQLIDNRVAELLSQEKE